MQIDNARHQRETAGVNDFGRARADVSDGGDAALADRHVGLDRVIAQAIKDCGPADHEIIHRHLFAPYVPAIAGEYAACRTSTRRGYLATDFADRETSIDAVKGQ